MATKRTRRTRARLVVNLDPVVLAFVRGEPVPEGVEALTEAQQDQIITAAYFGELTISGQRVPLAKIEGAVNGREEMDVGYLALLANA